MPRGRNIQGKLWIIFLVLFFRSLVSESNLKDDRKIYYISDNKIQ